VIRGFHFSRFMGFDDRFLHFYHQENNCTVSDYKLPSRMEAIRRSGDGGAMCWLMVEKSQE